MPRKSPASPADPRGPARTGRPASPAPSPGGAYAAGLRLLALRELSTAQLRTRLLRRGYEEPVVEEVLTRLAADRALDDRRVAEAAARQELTGRLRGRLRALQRLHALGVDRDTADQAVRAVLAEHDETTLLDRALARRLRGRSPAGLERQEAMRLAAALARQGFAPSAVLARLRALRRTDDLPDDE